MEFSLNAYDLLPTALDEAGKEGHLPNPSVRVITKADKNDTYTKSYFLFLRSRLTDLGYLAESPQNRSKDTVDRHLLNAIRKFQKEAGLKEDAWAGTKTWKALQQFVSFEDEQNPAEWGLAAKDFSRPAIRRAVYLRLYALGFFDWDQKLNPQIDISPTSNKTFRDALANFLSVAAQIGITAERLDPQIDLNTLGALFNQDGIIHALARHPVFVANKDNKRFVDSVARIELWLLGFDVRIGNPRYRLQPRVVAGTRDKVTYLSAALAAFWKQQPAASRPKTQTAKRTVRPAFFNRLVALENSDEASDGTVQADLIERIRAFTPDEQDLLKNKLKNIASSIWDGIKRVFRWIKRFVKRIAASALNLIKNIARLIANKSRSIFYTIRKSVEILHRGTVYVRNRLFPGSDARHAAFFHDNDMDLAVFVNRAADPEVVRTLMYKNYQESYYFRAACRILGHLIAIIRRLVQTLAGGIGGWFLALLALTRLAMRFRAIAAEVDLVDTFDSVRYPTPFANTVTT